MVCLAPIFPFYGHEQADDDQRLTNYSPRCPLPNATYTPAASLPPQHLLLRATSTPLFASDHQQRLNRHPILAPSTALNSPPHTFQPTK